MPVSAPGPVTGVVITLDFHKSGETCEEPGDSWPFTGEISFVLTSPELTAVTLIRTYSDEGGETYAGDGPNGRVQVTLDDSATDPVGVNGFPETGVFRPAEPLSAFIGEDPNGTWTLDVIDSVGSDPQCYYGASLVISADAETTTMVTATPSSITVGDDVTLTATVTGESPTGDVEFFIDGVSVGSAAVADGQAELPVSDLAVGTYEVTASYSGDDRNEPSESDPVTVTVAAVVPPDPDREEQHQEEEQEEEEQEEEQERVPSSEEDLLAESGSDAPTLAISAALALVALGGFAFGRTRRQQV